MHEYLEEFEGKQDVLRYVLTANAPETKDNDFTWKDFQNRNNNELVAVLGNFINRTLVLINKYFDGIVPEAKQLDNYDNKVLSEIPKIKEKVEKSLDNYRFREALKEALNLARLGNKYLADKEPWKIIKQDEQKVKTILNICLQITANLSHILEPFLPNTSQKIRSFLNYSDSGWNLIGSSELLNVGHKTGKAELLFAKIDDKEIEYQVEKLLKTKSDNEDSKQSIIPPKPNVTFDDFTKLDIRTGTILEAEKIPKTKKLIKLLIDTGIDKRTVVSGIAEFFEAEKIMGKKVSILINLEPRKIRGIESQGMILMAENSDGVLSFVSTENNPANGSLIK